ncbi:hypothetical protein AMQ84_12440 [Paenibacillus riograndensis]|uniref:ABC transporter permease n=1 Tax=Paenibacillus riograndensis TaxID=483937 RepID=A0A132U1V8_9BACL|nr:FtsX-like permease family protein [Paenibacillus riograndensis]KWX77549.1 hypothetical protein AMQ84_12440 [Paenibacillus riograndensis]
MILPQKMFRDIWHAKAQFLTIIIIVACGIFTFVGAITVGGRLEKSVSRFYDASRINDIWINVQNASDTDLDAIKQLPGVEEVQGRAVLKMFSGNRSVDVFVLNGNKLSRPYPVQGQPYQAGGKGIWLDREFAAANGLKAGDTLDLGLASGRSGSVVIQGLVLSPEKLIDISSKTLSTRHDLYGYGYMDMQAASESFRVSGMNQIMLKIKQGADGQALIRQAENLLGGKYLDSMTHKEHPSTAGAANQIAQFKTVGYVTPVLFFSLAVLVMVSTMSRLIANQRTQIGTMMSLGFSTRQIRRHYITYGLVLGIAGGLIGLVSGYYGIPKIFMGTLTRSFILPEWTTAFPVEALLSVAAVCGCCVLAVLLACGNKLKQWPAAVLRGSVPPSPGHSRAGSRLNLRLPSSFDNVWMLRNLKAHKMRALMGVIGAFGCTFLILFGFANIDSSGEAIEAEFGRQNLFALKADINATSISLLPDPSPSETPVQYIQEAGIQVKSEQGERNLLLTVLDNGEYINLDVNSSKPVAAPQEGIVLSENTAGVLGVQKGERIKVRFAGGAWRDFRIADTIQAPAANKVYLSRRAWEKSGEAFVVTSVLLGGQANLERVKEAYPVTQIVSKEEIREANAQLNEGVFASAAGLTVAAIFLGVAVIYSLGLISLTERSREFATLKVLGFRQQEIRRLLVRENLLLTLAGIALAVPAAWEAIQALAEWNADETIMLFPKIRLLSYFSAICLTLLSSYAVNRLMSRKISHIDMVTSLKAVD